MLRTEVCSTGHAEIPPSPAYYSPAPMGRGQAQPSELGSCCCVTANSILSPAQSARSACATEVEAVPSGATVGPNRPWGKGGLVNSVMPLQGKNSSRE